MSGKKKRNLVATVTELEEEEGGVACITVRHLRNDGAASRVSRYLLYMCSLSCYQLIVGFLLGVWKRSGWQSNTGAEPANIRWDTNSSKSSLWFGGPEPEQFSFGNLYMTKNSTLSFSIM